MAAIELAAAGDSITFNVTGTIILTSRQLTINKDLTITGPGVASLTISGNNAERVFFILGGNVAISGVTIRHGHSYGDGGGIYNQGTLTITNSIIGDNSADGAGGGIYNIGTLTITSSP